MIAKKVKYKLSNEAYKKIIELVKTLPPLQLLGKDGQPLSRSISKFKGIVIKDGKKFKEHQKGTEPILVNHKLKLIAQFETYGYEGINNYVAYVEKIVEMQKQAEENRGKNIGEHIEPSTTAELNEASTKAEDKGGNNE